MTLGEYRVGISFNPSANPTVDAIKRIAADFIDMLSDPMAVANESAEEAQAEKFRQCCHSIDVEGIPERSRLINIALGCIGQVNEGDGVEDMQILIEDAAMWAVRAATKGPME